MIHRSCKINLVSLIWNSFQSRSLSNKTCIFTRPHRPFYLRLYPTVIVRPDGATYTVRYEEPRKIIKLPIDLATLTEEERAKILENRRPKKKFVFQQEEEDNYDHTQYLRKLGKRT